MAKTLISDVIIPTKFNQYVIHRTAELSALSQSGIISNNPELDGLAAGGGKYINMPYWNDLSGSDEVLSDTVPLTPAKITSGQDIAALYLRGKAWSTNDLAHVMAGSDPMSAIGDLVATYWARRRQDLLFAMLKGVFSAASMSTNVYDISAGTGAAAVISGTEVLNAKQKLGDSAGKLTAISMHSMVFTKLQQDNLIAFIPNAEGKVIIPTYLGYRVIVDDGHEVAANVYTSYLFGEGAIGLGNGMHKNPVEFGRDILAGDDILVNRQAFVLHPRGIKFNGSSVAGASPSNTEAATGTNWTKVYDTKDIRIVQFKHKIA